MNQNTHPRANVPNPALAELGFEPGEVKKIILGFKEHDGVIGVLIQEEGVNGDLDTLSKLLQFTLEKLEEID